MSPVARTLLAWGRSIQGIGWELDDMRYEERPRGAFTRSLQVLSTTKKTLMDCFCDLALAQYGRLPYFRRSMSANAAYWPRRM